MTLGRWLVGTSPVPSVDDDTFLTTQRPMASESPDGSDARHAPDSPPVTTSLTRSRSLLPPKPQATTGADLNTPPPGPISEILTDVGA